MKTSKLYVLDFAHREIRILHLTWFAFFLTFFLWFSYVPLKPLIINSFNITTDQWKALLILNIALTIPARVIIGLLADRFGPRVVYSILLASAGLMSIAFACAQTYEQLALIRFIMGFIGAGFVVGIKLIGEWFPPRHIGLAEGIYGGWGNFGSAAAAMLLPTFAVVAFGGENGWRYAICSAGVFSISYGVLFYIYARNTPESENNALRHQTNGLQFYSRKDFYMYVCINAPMYLALALMVLKLSPLGTRLLSQMAAITLCNLLLLLFVYQIFESYKACSRRLNARTEPHERLNFKQVAVLSMAYFVTFGSELAIVSILPVFFLDTFEGVSLEKAGILGSAFAFMNLIARPAGGLFSDNNGRRKALSLFIVGSAIGYFTMSQISADWPLALAVIAVMMCSFFVQAGEGAVFAAVPIINQRYTGKIAGIVGAYGNIGGVTLLTIYSFVDVSTFFILIGGISLGAFALLQFFEEPAGLSAEVTASRAMRSEYAG